MDEDVLNGAAEDCRHVVHKYGTCRGFSRSDLALRVSSFAKLRAGERRGDSNDEQFRAMVLLAKLPGVACSVGRKHALRFYPQRYAPPGALILNPIEGETNGGGE